MRVCIEQALFDDDIPFSQVEDFAHRVLSLSTAPEAHKRVNRVGRHPLSQSESWELSQIRYCFLGEQHSLGIVRLPALRTVGPRIERARAVDSRAFYPEHI